MARGIKVVICAAMLLALVPVAGAEDITGVVLRTDTPAHVIVLEEGRMYRVSGDDVVMVDGQPIMLQTLQPGTRVVIRGAEPVMLRDGRYVVIVEPASTVSDPAALPRATVVTAPAVINEPIVRGRVVRFDERGGLVVLDDGRSVQTRADTAALVDRRPVEVFDLRPGMDVVLTAIDPVVDRSGRYVLLNEGFGDDNGFPLALEADFEGYEADIGHGGTQVQAP
jgi:hypothetical protein